MQNDLRTTEDSKDALQRTAEIARRQALRPSLDDWWERLAERSSTWDLETVKHLVVLNAAGFAGAATLLAGSRELHPRWVGCATLLGYGFGVALAILNMYLVSLSFARMLDEVKRRIVAIHDLTKPTDRLFDQLTAGRCFRIAGQICGWGAAILAILSTIAVGVSLVK